jgi:hypothetical protein
LRDGGQKKIRVLLRLRKLVVEREENGQEGVLPVLYVVDAKR